MRNSGHLAFDATTSDMSVQRRITLLRVLQLALLVLHLAGCSPMVKTAAPTEELHSMGGFTVSAGQEFLRTMIPLDTISRISIIDCRRERNEYHVNRRWVFADTLQAEHPNLVNYVTLSQQLLVEPRAMLAAIRAFDAMRVNEYHRMDGYVFLKVAVGFTTELGYVHVLGPNGQLGVELPYFGACLLLKRDLGYGWFEVEGDACRH